MSNANFQNRVIASQVMVGSTYVITGVTGTHTYYYTIESIRLTKAKRYVFTYSYNQKNNLTGKDFIQQGKSTAVVGHKEVFDYILNN